MRFQVDNITFNIVDKNVKTLTDKDFDKLAQYVYAIVELGIKREKNLKVS